VLKSSEGISDKRKYKNLGGEREVCTYIHNQGLTLDDVIMV
jgi:hypothetical protein